MKYKLTLGGIRLLEDLRWNDTRGLAFFVLLRLDQGYSPLHTVLQYLPCLSRQGQDTCMEDFMRVFGELEDSGYIVPEEEE